MQDPSQTLPEEPLESQGQPLDEEVTGVAPDLEPDPQPAQRTVKIDDEELTEEQVRSEIRRARQERADRERQQQPPAAPRQQTGPTLEQIEEERRGRYLKVMQEGGMPEHAANLIYNLMSAHSQEVMEPHRQFAQAIIDERRRAAEFNHFAQQVFAPDPMFADYARDGEAIAKAFELYKTGGFTREEVALFLDARKAKSQTPTNVTPIRTIPREVPNANRQNKAPGNDKDQDAQIDAYWDDFLKHKA